MRRVLLGAAGIPVSRVAFGTGSLHHVFSRRARDELLDAASGAGITHFDTAPYYGFGMAERDLGRLLCAGRSACTVATKVGLYPPGGADGSPALAWIRKGAGKVIPRLSLPNVDWGVERARTSLRESLRRLQTDFVDVLFLHEPDPGMLHAEEVLRWLESEVAEGRIRAWGIAGGVEVVQPWVRAGHPLASLVQTRDTMAGREADFLTNAGRDMQLTYGYLSAAPHTEPAATVLRRALDRNRTGAIVVSTRRLRHVRVLGTLGEA